MPRRSEEFGKVVTNAINALGLKSRAAAEKVDVSHTTILNWGRGEIPALPDAVRQLADGLNIPRTTLLRLADYGITDEDIQNDFDNHGIEFTKPFSGNDRASVKSSVRQECGIPGRTFIRLQEEGSPMTGVFLIEVNDDFGDDAKKGWTLVVDGKDAVQPGDLLLMVTRGSDGEEHYIADTLKEVKGETYCFARGEEAAKADVIFTGIILSQLKPAKDGPTVE